LSNPFESAVLPAADTDWVAQARPGPVLGLCAFTIAIAGLTGALIYPQLWVFDAHLRGFFENALPILISLTGLAMIPLGGVVSSGRLWAAVLTVPATGLLTLMGLTWLVYTLLGGTFAPIYVVLVLVSGVGVGCSVIAVGSSMRVHRARQALLSD
jgi:hypothetical protein